MPLSYADIGKEYTIKKIGGNAEMKKHMENIGFNIGSHVRVVNSFNGNLIVIIKEIRVAVSKELAQRVMV